MVKLTDKEIIEQLKKGNTDVFKLFYADFTKITSFIMKNNGGTEMARDIFHEALIVLYEKIINDDFKLESKLSTYLFSICKNMWLMHVRDNKPHLIQRIDNEKNKFIWGEDSFEIQETNEGNEQRLNIIMQQVKEMEEPCLSILTMFYFHKMSYRLIAEKLKYKTEKVVKNQKYRCIQNLKDKLPADFLEKY